MNPKKIYAAIFVIALATLAFEITLSRLLSVVTWYSLSFFAISVAMLGMTVGAIRVFLWGQDFAEDEFLSKVRKACYGFAFSAPLAVVAVCLLTSGTDILSAEPFARVSLFLALTVSISSPFYFSGVAISAILTQYPLQVNRLYASDLIGASTGCLVVLGGLSSLDTPSFGILCGFIGASAGLILHREISTRSMAALLVVTVGVIYVNATTRIVRPKAVKSDAAMGTVFAEIDEERWNSFSRVVISGISFGRPAMWAAHGAFLEGTYIAQAFMSIDGLAGTTVRRYSKKSDLDHLKYDVTNIAYFIRPTGGAAIMGVGGGKDIHAALSFGHEQVLGVELNPIFIELQNHKFLEFSNLGNNDKVTLVVDEARSYMSHSTEKFNLLQMALIDTWAATGAGAYSLSENSLYTVEAWKIFLDRLADDGVFTVSRWFSEDNPGETARMMSLAMAALIENGASDPASHIALVTHQNVATLILCESPLTDQDISKLRKHSAELMHEIAIIPGETPRHPLLAKIVASETIAGLHLVSEEADFNVSPTTDQNPYFFNMLKLDKLDALEDLEAGVLTGNLEATRNLIMLIGILVFLIFPTIVVPLVVHSRKVGGAEISWPTFFFFALIGSGFMCVEIALLQRLSVFLGHPVYALGILLFSVIAATGLGSLASEKFNLGSSRSLVALSLVAVISIAGMQYAMNQLIDIFMTDAILLRIAVSIACIFPMGFVMGFFFPAGMNIAKESSGAATAWYWAINGIFGVLFSAVSVFISIYAGIALNFQLGMVLYGLTGVCFVFMVRPSSMRSANERGER